MRKNIIAMLLAMAALGWSRDAKALPMGQITTSSKASVPNIEISGTHIQNLAADKFVADLELDDTDMNRDSMFIKMNRSRNLLYKRAAEAGFSEASLEHQSFSTDEKWKDKYDKKNDKYERYFVGYHIHQNFKLSSDTKKQLLVFLNNSTDIPHLSIERVSPSLKDYDSVRSQMMTKATEKAVKDASIYAKAAKGSVGRVLYIADGEYFDIRPHYVHFYAGGIDDLFSGFLGGGSGGIGDAKKIITQAVYDEHSIADSLEVGASVLLIMELK